MARTRKDATHVVQSPVKDARVAKKPKQTVSIAEMFKKSVRQLKEEEKPSHIKKDTKVIAKKTGIATANKKASKTHLSLPQTDVAETYRQSLLSAAASSLDHIHSTLHARLTSSANTQSSGAPHHENNVTAYLSDHISSASLPRPQPNHPSSDLSILSASLADTNRRLATPLASETLRFRPSGGADAVSVRLGREAENFATMVAEGKKKVAMLQDRRTGVVRQIAELVERMSATEARRDEAGQGDRVADGKGKAKETGGVASGEGQLAAAREEFNQRMELLREEAVGVGKKTLEDAQKLENELDLQRRERNKQFLDYAKAQL
ncbi:MAG: hypothetical protein Q9165_000602 [Trypethelium subeluteriae]